MRLECNNPSAFRIEADGAVYAARSIQLSPQHAAPLLIKATDGTTQQQWVTQVRMEAAALSSQQVNAPPSLHSLAFARQRLSHGERTVTAESFHKLCQVF